MNFQPSQNLHKQASLPPNSTLAQVEPQARIPWRETRIKHLRTLLVAEGDVLQTLWTEYRRLKDSGDQLSLRKVLDQINQSKRLIRNWEKEWVKLI